MKKLFEKIFKKEPPFNYIIADYQPVRINSLKTDVSVTEYQVDLLPDADEMDIDKIYQSY